MSGEIVDLTEKVKQAEEIRRGRNMPKYAHSTSRCEYVLMKGPRKGVKCGKEIVKQYKWGEAGEAGKVEFRCAPHTPEAIIRRQIRSYDKYRKKLGLPIRQSADEPVVLPERSDRAIYEGSIRSLAGLGVQEKGTEDEVRALEEENSMLRLKLIRTTFTRRQKTPHLVHHQYVRD